MSGTADVATYLKYAKGAAYEGDHGSNADKSLALALQFFQQFN